MAYTDTPNRTRRRRKSSGNASTPRRRRRKKQFRLDFIFLALVVLVAVIAITMPRAEQSPSLNVPNSTTNPATTEPMTIATEEPVTEPEPTVIVREPLRFTAADEDTIHVKTYCSGFADSTMVENALQATLDWDMMADDFTVLIIHSHISESYTKTDGQTYDNKGGDPYRTDDERYNMVAIGQRVAEILRENGIRVIHDTTSFEYPNSDYSYSNAREHLADVLAENPDIGLILDIHRDAVTNSDGTQWAPTITVDGKESAEVSMLIGYSGSYDHYWNQNLSFAVKLGAQLNKNNEGMFRLLVVNYSNTIYNQDFGPVSMLVEVGTAGNSLEEALNCAECVAEALVDMAKGANIE